MPQYPDPRPSWVKREGESVFDSPVKKALRAALRLTGMDDPNAQVQTLMMPLAPAAKGAAKAAGGVRAALRRRMVQAPAPPVDPPAVGRRIGMVGPDGLEHVARKTGGLGGYGEDHTDIARRLLGDEKLGIREALRGGHVRYWLRNGELALNMMARQEQAARNALKFIDDNWLHGDRIYLDIEGAGPTIGHFFDSPGDARRAIREAGGLFVEGAAK